MDSAQNEKTDVKSEVARTLIEAMKQNNTPWQKPWNSQALLPMNPTSGNAYRGINRLLLSLSGRSDPRWMTYQQASTEGWQVRRGEKGSHIIKLVELSPGHASDGEQAAEPGSSTDAHQQKRFALKRYTVFNAEQIEGLTPFEAPSPLAESETIARAERVMEALRQTGLSIAYSGNQAFYSPALDKIQMPPKASFHSTYDLYSTLLHEGAHSTLHVKRMNRTEAISKQWGDEAYALEELRAEICSAILAAETGVPRSQSNIDNHAQYLNAWIKSLTKHPMALFSAAKDAELMSAYMLNLEAKLTAQVAHQDWIAEYDQALASKELELAHR
ncbi:Antirestriction protein ArdC [Duganella sacchari]|uniref:Antirestriction protein ArdC n=1 Tax=Duganella sacchari TaxID=551987 RepID=A0A1M7R5P0_9BURK|nr:zincin-like metallopeptidase domain-containing protein [Duganella sacchari]SHN40532.1 Antirestriction protein ArdC [Duganella sacchari]